MGIICPNETIAEIANNILASSNEKAVVVVSTGPIEEAVSIAYVMIDKGVEVIITRSATAVKLKESFNIPVLDMGIKTIDILKAVKKASSYGKRVGIIVYDDIIFSVNTIKYMLEVDAIPIFFNVNDTIEEKEDKIHEKLADIDVGVGGSIAIAILAKYGIKGILIESEIESIRQIINEAKTIVEFTQLEKQRVQELSTIFNYTHEGVVTVDKNGMIKFFNGLAEKVFKKQSSLVIGKRAGELLPQLCFSEVMAAKEPSIDEIITVGDNTIVSTIIPLKTGDEFAGAICLFQESSKIQGMEGKIRLKLNEKGYLAKYTISDIITGCEQMENVVNFLSIYSKVNSTILIMGETGTGKEIVAQSIHNASLRATMPFVAINCGALPDNLLESELFGYEDGAFTGAKKGGKPGLFEIAHGGTIFLDEIGEISEKVQLNLLRVLEEKQVMRIGGNKLTHVDVRVICATNKNLKEEVKKKAFREDLFYRLNVLAIKIPPLRQRKESIRLFIDYFVTKLCAENNIRIKSISNRAAEYLVNYDWPGNVRELQNFIERLIVSVHRHTIDIDDVRSLMDIENETPGAPHSVININIAREYKEIEKEILNSAFNFADKNHTRTSKMLNISRATLWRKLDKKQ